MDSIRVQKRCYQQLTNASVSRTAAPSLRGPNRRLQILCRLTGTYKNYSTASWVKEAPKTPTLVLGSADIPVSVNPSRISRS